MRQKWRPPLYTLAAATVSGRPHLSPPPPPPPPPPEHDKQSESLGYHFSRPMSRAGFVFIIMSIWARVKPAFRSRGMISL